MSELLERAIDRIRALPHETQDAFARVLLQLAGDNDVYQLSAEEKNDLAEADREIADGLCASETEVRAVLAKYRA